MSSLLVFNRVYRLEIQSVMLVFSTPLVNKRPSNLLTGSPTPLPTLPCVNKYTVYTYRVSKGLGGGGGMGSLAGTGPPN